MKSLKLIVALSAMLLSTAFAQDRPAFPATPDDARIIKSDIENFYAALELIDAGAAPVATLQRVYLDKGSKGVAGFIPDRIVSAEKLWESIERRPKLYRENLRQTFAAIPAQEEKIYAALTELERIYPEAAFPPVYFVVGRFNSGGAISPHGLIIGAEMYSLHDESERASIEDEWLRSVIRGPGILPNIVSHELIHFQQNLNFDDNTILLRFALAEGSADFIGELISGDHINPVAHEYGELHEKELWLEFSEDLAGTDINGWLYRAEEGGRPSDLGYFFGYRIAQAYYRKANDKHAALKRMLAISSNQEALAFLEESGYQGGQ